MEAVEQFLNKPGDCDVPVRDVFTPAMFAELRELMADCDWPGIERIEQIWEEDWAARPIVAGFMKDKQLGEKRLASMPDRITNSINTANGVANRPTVISCYRESMRSMDEWWAAWKRFMFEARLPIPDNKGQVSKKLPRELLKKLSRSKYPALTEEEEALSLPLQMLCQAIFDAILVHIVNSVSPGGEWMRIKRQLVDGLFRGKLDRQLSILEWSYPDCHVVCLQEAAAAFIPLVTSRLGDRYLVIAPASLSSSDQNSLILLDRGLFKEASVVDHTDAVIAHFTAPADDTRPILQFCANPRAASAPPVASGDLLAVGVERVDGRRFLIASFHGDTNGLATIPVLDAVHRQQQVMPRHELVFGLDANTYAAGSESRQGVQGFVDAVATCDLSTCFSNPADHKRNTTFVARTFLQPQLQKAVKRSALLDDPPNKQVDRNPKDFIVFSGGITKLSEDAVRDNTGRRAFVEDMIFPTLDFPSDHAVLSARLGCHTSVPTKLL